jgi:hypothetical protein
MASLADGEARLTTLDDHAHTYLYHMRMDGRMAKLTKKPKNLSLEADAIARGERYSELHGTNLSRLVSDFLRSLPLGRSRPSVSPAVRRLRGIAADSKLDRAAYREQLHRKYGGD